MPLCHDILVQLHSQYGSPTDGLPALPEYQPPSRSRLSNTSSASSPTYVPEFWDEANSVVNVYIAALPGANFWINYKIFDPLKLFVEPRHQEQEHGVGQEEEQYFVMKLFVGKEHLVTWCCGEKQGWQGKTMWGLFEDPEPDRAKGPKFDVLGRDVAAMGMVRSRGKKALQKRLLCFSAPTTDREGRGSCRMDKGLEKRESKGSLNKLKKRAFQRQSEPVPERFLEIKTYRAQGMKRIPMQAERFDGVKFEDASGVGIE